MAKWGGIRTSGQLKLDQELYSSTGINNYLRNGGDIKPLLKEFARLRKNARQRLDAFERSEYNKNPTYLNNRNKFNKTASELSERELSKLLPEVAKFYTNPYSSVKAVAARNKKALKALHQHNPGDFDFVNAENYQEFTEFMEMAEEEHLDSDQVGAAFKVIKDAKLRMKDVQKIEGDFGKWIDAQNELESYDFSKIKRKTDRVKVIKEVLGNY